MAADSVALCLMVRYDIALFGAGVQHDGVQPGGGLRAHVRRRARRGLVPAVPGRLLEQWHAAAGRR